MMKQASLDSQIAIIRNSFDWYDNLLRNNSSNKSIALEELPYITSDILDKCYYVKDISHLDGVSVYQTSGTSSGAKKKIYWSNEDHERYINSRTKIFRKYISHECKTACADIGTGHAAASAKEIFTNLNLEYFCIDYLCPVNEHIDLLNEKNPEVFFTMPMVLDRIIESIINNRTSINWKPTIIITVGDVVTEAWRRKVIDFFGMQDKNLVDVLGSIEVGSIAHQDHDLGLYIFDDGIHPEVLNRNGNEILVLTSFNRNMFPAIRFVTNDILEGFSEIEIDGEIRYVFKRIVGRQGDETKHGEKLSIYDINNAINTYLNDALFEVYKTTTDFVIKIASNELTDEIASQIISSIEELNPDVKDMIHMGIINPFVVKKVQYSEIESHVFKNSIRHKEYL